MKAEGFIWNGNYVTRSESFYTNTVVSFNITYGMIEAFISKIDTKKYKITHKGFQGLSNKQRLVATITIKLPLIFMEDLLEKLGVKNIEKDGNIDYYRSSMEKPSRNYVELKYWMFNTKTKQFKLTQTTPFVVNGIMSRGMGQNSHFICKRIS